MLQLLHYALKTDDPKYDRMCYMIRAITSNFSGFV